MQHASARCAARPSVSATLLALMSVLSALSFSGQVERETFPNERSRLLSRFRLADQPMSPLALLHKPCPPDWLRTSSSRTSPAAAASSGPKRSPQASPDGYTLLLGGTNVNAIPASLKNLGYDPIGSFAPVAAICADTMVLAVSPRVSANTVEELVQQAKKQPGAFKFGAPQGIYTHLAGEFFKVKTGTDILFVPTRVPRPRLPTCSAVTSRWSSTTSRCCFPISKRES